jgi:hypothetical protein
LPIGVYRQATIIALRCGAHHNKLRIGKFDAHDPTLPLVQEADKPRPSPGRAPDRPKPMGRLVGWVTGSCRVDISGLSKSCDGRSLSLRNAVISRMSERVFSSDSRKARADSPQANLARQLGARMMRTGGKESLHMTSLSRDRILRIFGSPIAFCEAACPCIARRDRFCALLSGSGWRRKSS